ncbi:hypothetical protein BDF14DRAFT_780056 [Spinellus fusiger]|nr:hypothetical protein BDF14DRAFT_780056 [Spinellus fusiger]
MRIAEAAFTLLLCRCLLAQAALQTFPDTTLYADTHALVGSQGSESGTRGFLVEPAKDPTGCRKVEPPCSDWVALVQWGECSLEAKISTMQQSGAIAIAVETDSGHFLGTLGTTGGIDSIENVTDLFIPSISLTHHEYLSLLYLSKRTETPMRVIVQQRRRMAWPWLDMLMMLLISPVLAILLIYTVYRLRNEGEEVIKIASMAFVNHLPVKVFQQEIHRESEGEACAICLEEYASDHVLRILPCSHQFHAQCVDAWLTTQQRICPICKRDITSTNEMTPLLLV